MKNETSEEKSDKEKESDKKRRRWDNGHNKRKEMIK